MNVSGGLWLWFGVAAIAAHADANAQTALHRSVMIEACDGRGCDTGHFPGDDERIRTYKKVESVDRMHPASGTGGSAIASHTTSVTTPRGGVVRRAETSAEPPAASSGTLSVSTTAFNYEGPARARGFGTTDLEAPLVLDTACTLELSGVWETETVIDGDFQADAVNATVLISLTGDRELTLLRGTSPEPGERSFGASLVLMPGMYSLSFGVEAVSDSTGVVGAAMARSDMRFEVTVQPLDHCLCEVAGDEDRIDFFDLMTFVERWLDDDPRADLDGAGVALSDLVAFLSCWLDAAQGGLCP